MTPTYVHPVSLVDSCRPDRMSELRKAVSFESLLRHPQLPPSTSTVPAPNYSPNHLAPFSPSFSFNNSGSPVRNTHPPVESVSSLSVNYQPSDMGLFSDQVLSVDYNNLDVDSASFLDDPLFQAVNELHQNGAFAIEHDAPHAHDHNPINLGQAPSFYDASPNAQGGTSVFPTFALGSVPIREGAPRPGPALGGSQDANSKLTPDTSASGSSSDDGLAPVRSVMPVSAKSPRVTVSLWSQDNEIGTVDNGDQYPVKVRPGPASPATAPRAWEETWPADRTGLDPEHRPTAEVTSPNQGAAQRKIDGRNHEVSEWLSRAPDELDPAERPHLQFPVSPDGIPEREIDLGHKTTNKPLAGQTYFNETPSRFTQEDRDVIRGDRNWADAPLLFPIFQPKSDASRSQPATSQLAIEKFERLCREYDRYSMLSRTATWGTRPSSLSNLEIEGVTSGSFLKKLSLNRERRPSILRDIRGLVRKPGATPKRSRADDDERSTSGEPPTDRPTGLDGLVTPTRQLSFCKKQQVPSINTAFVAMGSNMASIGTTHARSGPINAASTPLRSPGFLTTTLKKPLSRMRSKSDLPGKASLAGMWKKTGGPPVSALGKASATATDLPRVSTLSAPELEDEDEDEDDSHEDGDVITDDQQMTDDIIPDFAGFQQHVLRLNPTLATTNNYLVERIAYQQVNRYKSLLRAKVAHMQQTATGYCPNDEFCLALGGSAKVLDSKSGSRGPEALSSQLDVSDGDLSPLEGVITKDSLPADIPMPPTGALPAEFECQLCYHNKKFQKPSDWTKHVHEDVQPFMCTWERCRECKIFKRKADWVRHENEGHRHLEKWECNVEDCKHVCYRRDNFLQHLVREHKFPEPQNKTKAAIKRAGSVEPTWQKVEQCHMETTARPQDEPCRFCGRIFATWKKLTVHLAKHMEQISLPILRLVAAKELDAETLISPIQEPPPRTYPTSVPAGSVKLEPQPSGHPSAFARGRTDGQPGRVGGRYPTTEKQVPQPYMFGMVPAPFFQQPIYSLEGVSPSMVQGPMVGVRQGGQGPAGLGPQSYPDMPTTGPYMANSDHYIPVTSDMEPFPELTFTALGLQDDASSPFSGFLDPAASLSRLPGHGHSRSFSHSPYRDEYFF